MTDLIEEINKAEQSAREIISKAKTEAEELLEKNLKECQAIEKKSVEDSFNDRKDSVAMARQKAEEDARLFLSEKERRLNYLKEKSQNKEKELAEEIAGRIKNWQ